MDADHDSDQQDWAQLGRLVRERRAELGLTQAEVYSAGGPSPATLYLLESGHRGSYRPHILCRLERALDWGAGSIRRVLAGGRPILGEADETLPPIRDDRVSVSNGHVWMAAFRELRIGPRDKLLILSNLLEETIAELGTGVDESPLTGRVPGPSAPMWGMSRR
ncbi:hypothetical protein PA7_32920 [Pseudonocardia asaccharolytica DSM 44247 = NBRC 16224]|uniref:HTH cro/C1-type domain-containing protein n=1 Tax=Pseudonocardia asaccharolytica DSM 44247 = NBRC 16224 TaxID=1123024 RepID=A0A511D3V4_9PSEU|nr:hypothetical protein PA7_32920 [Pseudonocardia asaccharolytica DSM 44247 = NBRC 16224]